MKCYECGNEMIESVGDYHFTESGSDKIQLKDIPLLTCENCQTTEPLICSAKNLFGSISKATLKLLEKNLTFVMNKDGFWRLVEDEEK